MPIIVVYTKFDLFMASNQRKCKGIVGKGGSSLESAEKHFYDMYGQLFAKSTENIEGQIPYTIVSSAFVSPVVYYSSTSPSRIPALNLATTRRNNKAKYTRRVYDLIERALSW